jgi:hypothetical protein
MRTILFFISIIMKAEDLREGDDIAPEKTKVVFANLFGPRVDREGDKWDFRGTVLRVDEGKGVVFIERLDPLQCGRREGSSRNCFLYELAVGTAGCFAFYQRPFLTVQIHLSVFKANCEEKVTVAAEPDLVETDASLGAALVADQARVVMDN